MGARTFAFARNLIRLTEGSLPFLAEQEIAEEVCAVRTNNTVPGVTAHTGQSIGSPTALPARGEAVRGLSPRPLVPLAEAER